MSTAALALLLACSGEPTVPAQTVPAATVPAAATGSAVDLSRGRAQTVVHLLDQVTADHLELSPDNLPAGSREPLVTTLDSGWRRTSWGDGRIWEHPSPVHFEQDRFSAAPTSLALAAGGQPLAFDTRITEDSLLDRRWMLWQDLIYMASVSDPALWPDPPVLSHAATAEREATWNLRDSGQDPLPFARRSVSLGRLTHPCLYLPAPSSAALPVTVPAEGATLRLSVGIAVPDEVKPTAEASLQLSIDDQLLDRTTARAGDDWTPVTADLSPWAGQQITLRLASDPGGDATRDYLCVADPRIVAAPPAEPDPVRVVVIGIDTLRADHLGAHGYARPTSPNLDALAARSVVFDRAWAPAPRTRPSFRTSTTGRWPLRALGAPSFGQVLAAQGLATAGIVANVHLAPRLGFAEGFHHWSYDNGATADTQVDRALAWLQEHRDQDSFLFLHLMDPHTFYLAPEPFTDRFTEGVDRGHVPDKFNRWMVESWDQRGELSAEEKRFITGRYDGEVAFTDDQVGRLVRTLDAMPGRTLIIVHTDHGEELWDHGRFEHNHSLYDELTRAVLWIRPPGGRTDGLRRSQPASLADIPPTIYDALGLPPGHWPAMDGTSLWALVDPAQAQAAPALVATLDDRPLHQGYLMFDTERWSVVAHDDSGTLHKYILLTTSGEQHLFDLDADPAEQTDLAQAPDFDPTPWAAALSEATGWPVAPGWRLHLRRASQPLTLTFDQPVHAAGVVDPEAALTRRANLEWGQEPVIRPDDVATVSLSEDRRAVTIRAGGHGRGTVWILGPGAEDRAALDGGDTRIGRGALHRGSVHLEIEPGIIIVPLESEADALAATHGDGPDATAEQLQALRELGYLDD